MKIIAKPKREEEILASVDKKADSKIILKGMITKAECCVQHLCGCSSCGS